MQVFAFDRSNNEGKTSYSRVRLLDSLLFEIFLIKIRRCKLRMYKCNSFLVHSKITEAELSLLNNIKNNNKNNAFLNA